MAHKKDLSAQIIDRTPEEQVEDLAAAGHTREYIANWLGVSVYQVKEGQMSDAYKRGRDRAESDLLAIAHRRARDDEYRGADGNLNFLLKSVYGYREQSAVELTGNQITLILTPDDPNPDPAAASQ